MHKISPDRVAFVLLQDPSCNECKYKSIVGMCINSKKLKEKHGINGIESFIDRRGWCEWFER